MSGQNGMPSGRRGVEGAGQTGTKGRQLEEGAEQSGAKGRDPKEATPFGTTMPTWPVAPSAVAPGAGTYADVRRPASRSGRQRGNAREPPHRPGAH